VSPNESPHHNNIIINFKPLSRLLYSRPAAVVVVGWGVSASGEERKKKERKKEGGMFCPEHREGPYRMI